MPKEVIGFIGLGDMGQGQHEPEFAAGRDARRDGRAVQLLIDARRDHHQRLPRSRSAMPRHASRSVRSSSTSLSSSTNRGSAAVFATG